MGPEPEPEPEEVSVGLVTPPYRCIEGRAVSFEWLRRFTTMAVTDELRQSATDGAIQYLSGLPARSEQQERDLAARKVGTSISGRDFHKFVIKERTHKLGCRFVELAGCGDSVDEDGRRSVGLADCFVSWNWDSDWEILLSALGRHTAKAMQAGKLAPYYWMDIIAVNQHTALPPWKCDSGRSPCQACAAQAEDMPSFAESLVEDKGFRRVINSERCCETLVLLDPWFDPRPIGRVWCLYEILLTMRAMKRDPRKQLKVLLPLESMVEVSDALVQDYDRLDRVVQRMDAEKAQATQENDKTQIFEAVRQLCPRGFLDMNNEMKDQLRLWFCEAAEEMLEGKDGLDRMHLLRRLGAYYKDLGKLDKAQLLLEEHLAGWRSSCNPVYNIWRASIELGLVYELEAKHEYDRANPLLKEALDYAQQEFGDDHALTLECRTNLTLVCEAMGQHDEALQLLKEASEGHERKRDAGTAD